MGIVKQVPSIYSQLRAEFRKHDLDVSTIEKNEFYKDRIDIGDIGMSMYSKNEFYIVEYDIYQRDNLQMKFTNSQSAIETIMARYRALNCIKGETKK